ncbi:MAG: hypothetical protein ACE5HI_00620 [bacterium]
MFKHHTELIISVKDQKSQKFLDTTDVTVDVFDAQGIKYRTLCIISNRNTNSIMHVMHSYWRVYVKSPAIYTISVSPSPNQNNKNKNSANDSESESGSDKNNVNIKLAINSKRQRMNALIFVN